MTFGLSPGSSATPSDRLKAFENVKAIAGERTRVHAAAVAWRNGVAGIIVTLIGFSLIRGRSDIGDVASPYDVWIGLLLLASLALGGGSAVLILRAANGRIWPRPVGGYPSGVAGDHEEALEALTALRRGLAILALCVLALVAAVGLTWYAPARSGPNVVVVQDGSQMCGAFVRSDNGAFTLVGQAGISTVSLASVTAVRIVNRCP